MHLYLPENVSLLIANSFSDNLSTLQNVLFCHNYHMNVWMDICIFWSHINAQADHLIQSLANICFLIIFILYEYVKWVILHLLCRIFINSRDLPCWTHGHISDSASAFSQCLPKHRLFFTRQLSILLLFTILFLFYHDNTLWLTASAASHNVWQVITAHDSFNILLFTISLLVLLWQYLVVNCFSCCISSSSSSCCIHYHSSILQFIASSCAILTSDDTSSLCTPGSKARHAVIPPSIGGGGLVRREA